MPTWGCYFWCLEDYIQKLLRIRPRSTTNSHYKNSPLNHLSPSPNNSIASLKSGLGSCYLHFTTLETSPFVIHPRHWRKARPWASTPWDLHQQWRWVKASSNHHLFEIQTEVDYTPPVGDTFLCKTGSCPLMFLSTNPPSLFPSPPSQSCCCQNPGFKSPGLEIVGRRFEK